MYLMRCPSRNKDCISLALRVGIANDSILFVEPLPKFCVQENVLVVNGVGVGFQPLAVFKRNLGIHI